MYLMGKGGVREDMGLSKDGLHIKVDANGEAYIQQLR
jgi:hypothetical protein